MSRSDGTRSKSRWAKTVPIERGPGARSARRHLAGQDATRASSPIRPGSTAFANRPTEKAEKTSWKRGCGGGIAWSITIFQASARTITENEIEADRRHDPLPADLVERVSRPGPSPAPATKEGAKAGPGHEDDNEPQPAAPRQRSQAHPAAASVADDSPVTSS